LENDVSAAKIYFLSTIVYDLDVTSMCPTIKVPIIIQCVFIRFNLQSMIGTQPDEKRINTVEGIKPTCRLSVTKKTFN